jgi:hypothetical protein
MAAQMQARLDQLEAIVQALQDQNTNLQNEITALQNAPPPPAAPAGLAPAAAPAVVYAENPGRYDVNAIINFNTRLGTFIYDQGTKPLSKDFDMKSEDVVVFLQAFQQRCTEIGWSEGTMNITKFINSKGENIDLQSQYGQIDSATLKAQCERFCKVGEPDYGTRATQNNHMMGLCLNSSLTKGAMAKLQPYRAEYTFDGKIYAPLMFKVMMRLATIDSVATTEALRANLRELPAYASSVSGDIDKINQYFDQNYSQLIARGAKIDDPIGILFDAYRTVSCSHFRPYITRKHEMYLDGELMTLTHEQLMAMATDKFNYLKTKGLWGSQTEQEQIVAMAAQFEKLKGEFQLAKSLRATADKDPKDKASDKSTDKKKKDSKKKNKKNTKDRKQQKQDEAWKKVPPKAGEPKQKKSNDTTYNWCDHHMAWTVHTQAECKLGKSRAQQAQSATTDVANPAISTPSLPPAYAALLANMARCAADE